MGRADTVNSDIFCIVCSVGLGCKINLIPKRSMMVGVTRVTLVGVARTTNLTNKEHDSSMLQLQRRRYKFDPAVL